jgi:hypothetical protein
MTSRTVRVFLSSTFRDFGEERDLLVRRVFPALRARLKDRFVELVDVDLRWGITAEQAERGEVLPICLAEIDRSRPYFIGLLGERYGWVPPKETYPQYLVRQHRWLKAHQGGKSVTELEILHVVLNDSEMAGRARFYIRSSAYAKKKGKAYLPQDAEERRRQQALKKRVADSGFPIIRYATPKDLAKRLERDLWKILDELFPADQVPDAFERERLRHEAYAAPRRRSYLGGERYTKTLTTLLKSEQRILITGQSGGGKSALLAKALVGFRRKHPRIPLFEHYLAASADAAEAVALVRRLIEFIKRQTDSTEAIAADPEDLFESLPTWLGIANAWGQKQRTRFVFVLDALNNLTTHRDLRWLPTFLPERVQVVISCLEGEVKEALETKGLWQSIAIEPLTAEGQVQLLRRYLHRYNKTLPEDLAQKALSHPLANNPLWLKTLAEELRLFGSHEELATRLETLLGAPQGKSPNEPATVDDLFEHVLTRIEADHGKALVRSVMTAIWASRAGLTEKEIVYSPKRPGITNLKTTEWAQIHSSLHEALLEVGGKIIFAHEFMYIAVRDRYLPTDAKRRASHRRLALWFHRYSHNPRRAEEETWQLSAARDYLSLRRILTQAEIFLHLWTRSPNELLMYWKDSFPRSMLPAAYEKSYRDWMVSISPSRRNNLTIALADALWEHGFYCRFGAELQSAACIAAARIFGARSVQLARLYIKSAFYLHHLADPLSLRLAKKAVSLLENKGLSHDLIEAYAALAVTTHGGGRAWEAKEVSERGLRLLECMPDSLSKHHLRHTVLMGWFNPVYPEEALPIFESLVKKEEQIFGKEDRRTIESIDLQVGCLIALERWVEAHNLGMSLYLRCYRAFGEDHVQTGFAAGKYGIACLKIGDLTSAEWGLRTATRILSLAFPDKHQSRHVFLSPLADTYAHMGRKLDADSVHSEIAKELLGVLFYESPARGLFYESPAKSD